MTRTLLDQRPHWVYRCYDAAGALLYIGVTSDVETRFRQHANPRSSWSYPSTELDERMASYTAEWFPNRAAAFTAEAVAIRSERPPMNVKHNEGFRLTPYQSSIHPRRENTMAELTPDYDLEAVAEALGMSVRWVRARIAEGAEHQRYGRKIRFTPEQVEKLRSSHTKSPASASITTGRKKRSA